jgi:BMFP domain-containing protein YqiC
MQKNSEFFSDLGKMMSAAGGTLLELRKEVEGMVTAQVEKMSGKMGLVSREEFEAVREMAQAARLKNEELERRLEVLEKVGGPLKAVNAAKNMG